MPVWTRALELVSAAGAAIAKGMARRPSRAQRQLTESLGGVSTFAGWTDNRHEQVRHYRGWTYIAIRAVARELADTLPKCGIQKAPGSGKVGKCLTKSARRKALNDQVTDTDGDLELFDAAHPLCKLLSNPNEPDIGYHLWFETYLWLALTGNTYWWGPPGGLTRLTGLPDEIWVLPSEWVTPNYKGTGKWVDSYTCRTNTGRVIEIDAEEIIHFRDPHPWDKRDGYSPLTAGSHWIDTENSLSRSRLAAFKNALRPSVGIELSEKIDPGPLDQAIERIYARYEARFAGEHNHGKPVVSAPGAKLVNLSTFSPTEMAFLESDNQIRDTVLSLFGVPYPVANIVGGATYENADAAERNFYRRTLNPLRRFIGQVVTEKLAHRFDENAIVFWVDDTPLDPKEERANQESLFDRGGLTMNERRAVMGMEPLDDPNADKLYILSSYVPLEDASMPEPTAADGGGGFDPEGGAVGETAEDGVLPGPDGESVQLGDVIEEEEKSADSPPVAKGNWREEQHQRATDGRFGTQAGEHHAHEHRDISGKPAEGHQLQTFGSSATTAELVWEKVKPGDRATVNGWPCTVESIKRATHKAERYVKDADAPGGVRRETGKQVVVSMKVKGDPGTPSSSKPLKFMGEFTPDISPNKKHAAVPTAADWWLKARRTHYDRATDGHVAGQYNGKPQ